MAVHYLEFEKPIADLEAKIEELNLLSSTSGSFDAEVESNTIEVYVSRLEAKYLAQALRLNGYESGGVACPGHVGWYGLSGHIARLVGRGGLRKACALG